MPIRRYEKCFCSVGGMLMQIQMMKIQDAVMKLADSVTPEIGLEFGQIDLGMFQWQPRKRWSTCSDVRI